MKRFVYVVGEPGVGKSTAVATALGPGIPTLSVPLVPHSHHIVHGRTWVQIGAVRTAFSGTDALAMNAQPKVVEWLGSPAAPPYVLAEGDRLTNEKFFSAVQRLGYRFTVVYLRATKAECEARRAQRAAVVGKVQNASWVQGRQTKVQRLIESTMWDVHMIDASRSPDLVAHDLLEYLKGDPAAHVPTIL